MVPYINYIENHFLIKRRRQSRWLLFFSFLFLSFSPFFLTYKVTFLFGKLKVQKRPTFLSPQFISNWGFLCKSLELSGRELSDRSGQQECSVLYLPASLPAFAQTYKTHHCAQTTHRQFFIQKWPFKTCHPLTAWFPAPEGKEVKKQKKNTIRQNAELDKGDKDAMFELDTLWWTASVLRD